MEFGLNNYQPLLSIAVPTWNRAKQLEEALGRILPSVSKHSDVIEFIISDNASDDNTQEVISRTLDEFKGVNFVSFRHDVNSGFYGNFKKCISLGTGKYFWLLSDDDFVFDGVLDTIIDILSSKSLNVGAIFLNDWTEDAIPQKHTFDIVDIETFFKIGNYRHTLISSVIYAHTVSGEDEIFEKLRSNSLIGYPIFLKAVSKFKEFAILNGNSLLKTNTEVRFDALQIFTTDLAECLKLGYKYISKKTMDFISNQFISILVFTHYKDFRYRGRYNTDHNQSLNIFKFYTKYKNFWFYIFPLILLNESKYKKFDSFVRKLRN